MQYLPDGFLQMIFIDTNGFDRQHYKFDYVRREFLGEVRCLVFDVIRRPKRAKAGSSDAFWVEDQDFHIVRFTALTGSGHTSWYFHFEAGATTRSQACGCVLRLQLKEKDLHYALTKKRTSSANAPVGIQRRPCRAGARV